MFISLVKRVLLISAQDRPNAAGTIMTAYIQQVKTMSSLRINASFQSGSISFYFSDATVNFILAWRVAELLD